MTARSSVHILTVGAAGYRINQQTTRPRQPSTTDAPEKVCDDVAMLQPWHLLVYVLVLLAVMVIAAALVARKAGRRQRPYVILRDSGAGVESTVASD